MVHDKSSRETPLNGRGRHDPDQDIGVEFELMTQEDQTSLETIITEEGALAGTEDSHSEQTHGRSLADAPASSAKGKQSSDLAAGPESPSKANERRAYIRYKLNAPVELTDSRTGQTSQAVVTDVGRGGCFVKTNSPAAIGTTLKLSITQSDQCFRARARAVSIQPGQGMGILFTEVEAEDLEGFGTVARGVDGDHLGQDEPSQEPTRGVEGVDFGAREGHPRERVLGKYGKHIRQCAWMSVAALGHCRQGATPDHPESQDELLAGVLGRLHGPRARHPSRSGRVVYDAQFKFLAGQLPAMGLVAATSGCQGTGRQLPQVVWGRCKRQLAAAVLVAWSVCWLISAGFVVFRMSLALATSSAVPWATTRNLSAFIAVSYLKTLSLGMPTL